MEGDDEGKSWGDVIHGPFYVFPTDCLIQLLTSGFRTAGVPVRIGKLAGYQCVDGGPAPCRYHNRTPAKVQSGPDWTGMTGVPEHDVETGCGRRLGGMLSILVSDDEEGLLLADKATRMEVGRREGAIPNSTGKCLGKHRNVENDPVRL